jgi:hypothetical protein
MLTIRMLLCPALHWPTGASNSFALDRYVCCGEPPHLDLLPSGRNAELEVVCLRDVQDVGRPMGYDIQAAAPSHAVIEDTVSAGGP